MSETPEEIARRIVEHIPYTFPEIVDENALAAMIAQAIRDAYERAAIVADESINLDWPGDDISDTARSIAREIRELKEPA